jgi:hypothetical protein
VFGDLFNPDLPGLVVDFDVFFFGSASAAFAVAGADLLKM